VDWTKSRYVAAYFAACSNDKEDGEILSFDYSRYELKGKEQWSKSKETTTDASGNPDSF